MRTIACLILVLLAAAPGAAVCSGDCDGNGQVQINELVTGVGIALGQSPVATCAAVDNDGNGEVTIAELIAAANALLSGCPLETTPTSVAATATAPPTGTPSGTPTATPTASETPTATPTVTANQPPSFPSPFAYRGIAGQPIARPLGAVDPEGDPVTCAADTLLAGMTLEPDNILRWTPAAEQIGLFDVPVSCRDAAEPPLVASGELAFRITPPDSCAPATCDPATGCSQSTLPLSQPCCEGHDLPRLPEADVFCPEGRRLLIGLNTVGFGALQNCDRLRFRQRAQSSGDLRFHIRVSCLNTLNRVTVSAKLENPTRGLLIDPKEQPVAVFLADSSPPGFAERRNLIFGFTLPGPYLTIEETEANLTVTVRDSDGAVVSETLRVILTSQPTEDPPDL